MIARGVKLLLFCAVLGAGTNVNAKHKVVLVTGRQCPLAQLSSLDLRKIYFGFRLERHNFVIRGVRNLGDDQLEQVFLQSVVAMSRKSYARRMLWLRLNYGIPKLTEFKFPQEFIERAKNHPCDITYMRQEEVPSTGDLKILDSLWESD